MAADLVQLTRDQRDALITPSKLTLEPAPPFEDSVVMDTEPEPSSAMFRLGDRKAMKTRALPGEHSEMHSPKAT
jgi:hypothetical protein